MVTKSKVKWVLSIILGAILLVTALTGGNWGTISAASAGVYQTPIITDLMPSAVPAGSPTTTVVISGANFGTNPDCIRLWVKDLSHDYRVTPTSVLNDGISAPITDTLLVSANQYLIAVVKSTCYSIPPVPPDPQWDLVSNAVPFIVYTPFELYLPFMHR